MITNIIPTSNREWDLRGLSTDTKPTDDAIPNGSSFLEIDTGKIFLFDAENHTWYPFGGDE